MKDVESELPPDVVPSAGEQAVPTPQQVHSLTKIHGRGGLLQTPKSQALLELEETGIRGGGMVLLRAIVLGLEDDLRRERIASSEAKLESDSWREKFFSEKEKAAVLQTQIDALTRMKILQNVLLSVGGIFGGLGVKLLVDDKTGLGAIFLVTGAVFLFTGWLWPTGFSKKEQPR
jgi:hypothetical protein